MSLLAEASAGLTFMLALQLGIPLFFIVLAVIVGGSVERAHFRSLRRREEEFAGVLVTDLKTFPGGVHESNVPALVSGSVVIASDYLKTFLTKLKNKSAHLTGRRCGACAHKEICGGCRLRAEFATGDVWADDPNCYHQTSCTVGSGRIALRGRVDGR